MTTAPLRVLTVGHSYAVGANRALARELARAGGERWRVSVAAPEWFHGNDLRPVALRAEPDEEPPPIPLPAHLTRWVHGFLYGSKLRGLLGRPWDVIHAWQEPYILAGGQIALWANRRAALVFRSAQSWDKRYPPPFNWVERYAMGRAAGWICSGELVEQTLAARHGYDKPHARIPLGVDTAAFAPNPAAGAAVRRQLGWAADGPPVVGFLGRFVPQKGLDVLTRALDGVAGAWRALFVGAGPMEPELRAWAARHGDRVRVRTDVTHADVPAFLNAVDVLCAPSQTTPRWREQFGRMLIEAFASGVPVVGSDSGEIPRVVRNCGVVVGEADVSGWSEAIGELLADPRRRCELARHGRHRAETEFAWPVVARQHLDFFARLRDERRA